MSAREAVLDTNVLIHAMAEDSPKYKSARDLISSLAKISLPVIVLYEVVWVLRKLGLGPEEVVEAVEALMANPRVNIVPDEGNFALEAIRRVARERVDLVNFNDKVILMTALSLKLPIATYDHELAKEAKHVGLETVARV